jgi:hypothetical protein
MKKNISKRLRHNEKEAEKFREELGDNINGEDRRELMALQYQVGRLELENMELEQHRIVHESILKGKAQDNEIVDKRQEEDEEVEINDIVKKQIKSLKNSMKTFGLKPDHILKGLKDDNE